ncbi:GEVED domain-containing protein [Longispora albida]|uniref:GEVED domain-containing protein n=1 Tax=Longispora albida TaxID=203523 RepID=UPI00036F38D7|nr:GEVED domain-containing protein [Longispora albida]
MRFAGLLLAAPGALVPGAALDYGDAPASYAITRADDGPRHTLSHRGTLTLGPSVTEEPDGGPGDADDGLTSWDGATATVDIRNGTGRGALLAGWLDTNRDGHFDSSELTVALASGGPVRLRWDPVPGPPTYLRLRLYGVAPSDIQPTGLAAGGEVEDHRVAFPAARPSSAAPVQPVVPESSPPVSVRPTRTRSAAPSPRPSASPPSPPVVQPAARPPGPAQAPPGQLPAPPLPALLLFNGLFMSAFATAVRAVTRAR